MTDTAEFMLRDALTEKKFEFTLAHSLDAAKRQDTRLFEGLQFYCTPSVKPGSEDMEEILSAAGATVLHPLPH